MHVNIHESYRAVVSVCDSELIGKKFEEGLKQLDLRERFYKGEELSEEQVIQMLQEQTKEDATFNIVGSNSINAAIKAGIIDESAVAKTADIPYALKLL